MIAQYQEQFGHSVPIEANDLGDLADPERSIAHEENGLDCGKEDGFRILFGVVDGRFQRFGFVPPEVLGFVVYWLAGQRLERPVSYLVFRHARHLVALDVGHFRCILRRAGVRLRLGDSRKVSVRTMGALLGLGRPSRADASTCLARTILSGVRPTIEAVVRRLPLAGIMQRRSFRHCLALVSRHVA